MFTGRVSAPPADVVDRPITVPDVPLAEPIDDVPLKASQVALGSVCRWLRRLSPCSLPNALAFAVKGALSMNARVIGGVDRAGLRAASAAGRHTGSVEQGPCLRASDRLNAIRADAKSNPVRVLLNCLGLPTCQDPRICSEADVRHGFLGDRRHWRGESHRRCAACHAPRQ